MTLTASQVWSACCDERGRLRADLRVRATEVRCTKGHLVAYCLPTVGGILWARRDPWVERDDRHGWEVGWAADDGIQAGRCSCQRSWLLDPSKVDHERRTMSPAELRPDTRESPVGAEHEHESSPFD